MIRITRGGFTFECETQADVKLAMAVFADVDEPPLPHISHVHIPVEVNAPDWRVGGPREPLPPAGSGVTAHYVPDFFLEGSDVEKPRLAAVPDTASPDQQAMRYLQEQVPQHITVSRKNREVLDAVVLFPEGVSTNSLSTLLGIKQVVVASRIQALKSAGLVVKVTGHRLWEATRLARRAKLVTG